MMLLKQITLILVLGIGVCSCFSDVGKWDLPLSGVDCKFSIMKSLFKGSKVIMKLHCDVVVETNITVIYKWAPSECSPDYFHYFEKQKLVECSSRTERATNELTNSTSKLLPVVGEMLIKCEGKETIILENPDKASTNEDEKKIPFSSSKMPPFFTVESDGVYMLQIETKGSSKFNATIGLEMFSPHGYLSASIWPLLVFFGVMCAIYTVLCACWMLVCALQWKDLLRIQYWIGGVALMGMVESATYYGVYSSINNTGYFNAEAYMFAEWMNVAKRALARMLVIIVSLGFGIVKPRLGPALQRVVGTGLLWGLLAGIEAWLRLHHKANDSNRDLVLSQAPLSVMDTTICWWVFVSLAHTMRTLQLRRNAVKLTLYRHFTNTLIFAVISSVIFMLYSIKTYKVVFCISVWREVWMDEAYWHILFSSVLTVIMVLWRPTNNNQRYAFTPLLDNADDEDDEEEQFVNDAYGVKMRGTSMSAGDNSSDGPKEQENSLDADLRWVEENIPTSTLPLLDSDEEIINTKFEVSKMQ